MCSIHHHRMPFKTWAVDESNLLIKSQYARENSLPTHSEIRHNLGAQLADIFFSHLPERTQVKIGLKPPMKCPGPDLWISPSQQLLGKLNLSPPLTRRYQQAVTHKGIIEIGDIALAKLERDYEKRLKEALRAKEIEVLNKLTHLFKNIVAITRYEEKEKYEEKLKIAIEELKKQYQEQMGELESQIRLEAKMEKERTIKMYKECIQEEVRNTILMKEKLSADDQNFKFQWQEATVREEYIMKRREIERRWERIFKEAVEALDVENEKWRAQMTAENNTLLIRTIIEERELAAKRLAATENAYRRQIEELLVELETKKNDALKLQNENEIGCIELRSWSSLLKEVVGQFQKFIIFVLKDKPDVSQFLFSLEKLFDLRTEIFQKEDLPELLLDAKGETSEILFDLQNEAESGSRTLLLSSDFAEVSEESFFATLESKQSSFTESDAISVINYAIKAALRQVFGEASLTSSEEISTEKSVPTPATSAKRRPCRPSVRRVNTSGSVRVVKPSAAISSQKSIYGPIPKYQHRLSSVQPPRREPEKLSIGAGSCLFGISDVRTMMMTGSDPALEESRAAQRLLKIIGEDVSCQNVSKEKFATRRLDSIIDILNRHPSLMRVVIKP